MRRYWRGVKINWRNNDVAPALFWIGLFLLAIGFAADGICVLFGDAWSWSPFALAAPFFGFGLYGILGGGLIDMPPKQDK